jgi:hypothetical protein
MLPSACSFLALVVTVLRYIFQPTWPSSSVYYIFISICLKESASLFFLSSFSRGYTLHVSICGVG